MEKFFIYAKKADFAAVSQKFNITPMLARIIRNRDIVGDEAIEKFLNGSLKDMYNPFLMKDLRAACDFILNAVEDGIHIRIMGDYDIDGVCSAYILEKYLRHIGANADVDIPDRISEGFGLNEAMVEKAIADGVGLIITCDNGVSAVVPVKMAKNAGISIIITDHHQIPDELPSADFIINPHQADCNYPYSQLCGGGVAYKLVLGLAALKEYEQPGNEKNYCANELSDADINENDINKVFTHIFFEKLINGSPLLTELLGFAGFATIGDIVPLQDENRILAAEGIKVLRKSTNIGLNALIKERKIDKEKINSYYVGFILGPCINSAGRLESAKTALKLLETDDESEAREIAAKLSALNEERKKLTEEGADAIKAILAEEEKNGKAPDNVLVFSLKDIHESVAGIVAGRIKEEFERPAIVITQSETGPKGSGRSTDDFNIIKAISAHPELFVKFGGHEKACGFTLKEEAFVDELRIALNDDYGKEGEPVKKVWIDMQLPFEYVSEDFIEELAKLEPFGMKNKKPLFAEKNIIVRDYAVFGRDRNVLKLTLENEGGFIMQGVIFGAEKAAACIKKIEDMKKEKGEDTRISVTYYPSVNEYNGKKSIQLIIENLM